MEEWPERCRAGGAVEVTYGDDVVEPGEGVLSDIVLFPDVTAWRILKRAPSPSLIGPGRQTLPMLRWKEGEALDRQRWAALRDPSQPPNGDDFG